MKAGRATAGAAVTMRIALALLLATACQATFVGLFASSASSESAEVAILDDNGKRGEKVASVTLKGTVPLPGVFACTKGGDMCYVGRLLSAAEGTLLEAVAAGSSTPAWSQSFNASVVASVSITRDDAVAVVLVTQGSQRVCLVNATQLDCIADFSQYPGEILGGTSAYCPATGVLHVGVHTPASQPDLLVPIDLTSHTVGSALRLSHGLPNGLTCDDQRIIGIKVEPTSNALTWYSIDISTGDFTTLQSRPAPQGYSLSLPGAYNASTGVYAGCITDAASQASSVVVTDFNSEPVVVDTGETVAGISV